MWLVDSQPCFKSVCGRKTAAIINVKLVLQHCCKTSWDAMLRISPPTSQTCLATNQVVASCEKFLQKVESSSSFASNWYILCVLLASHADILIDSYGFVTRSCPTRDEPLRTSAWEASVLPTQGKLNSRVWSDSRVILSIRSLYSRNLKPDLLQDRLWTWLVKRATLLSNSFWSNVARQGPRFCLRFTVA